MRTLLKLLAITVIGLALARRPGDSDAPGGTNPNRGSSPPPPVGGFNSGRQATKASLDKGEAGGSRNGNEDNADSGSQTVGQAPTDPKHPDKWADGNLESHFDDHRNDPTAEWDSMAEYQYAAIDLMTTEGGRRPGVRIKVTGDTAYYYDPATGEFGRSGPRGIITFFIPHPDPEAYFERQPGTEVPE